MKSTINLFKALPIEEKWAATASETVMEKTLRRGFVFSPQVVYNYSERELLEIADTISLTPEEMNSSLHKSWKKVLNTDIEQLVIAQMVHYLTTYGFEELGIYNENTVYIPAEELEIPEIDISELKLLIIKGYIKDELRTKITEILQTGIGLGSDTINDVLDIIKYVGMNPDDINTIKNKEIKIALYDYFNIIPDDSLEFLRYAVFKSTGETLLIKNAFMVDAIKNGADVSHLFLNRDLDLHKLAEIFYRFKPLFLAFRSDDKLKPVINKIRRFAVKDHEPMRSDYLNDITGMIKNKKDIDLSRLAFELKNANIFRRIRLAYALHYRTHYSDSIMYKIRNGKSYATEFKFDYPQHAEELFNIVLKSIIDDLNVKDKKIFIPEYMTYTLPATEKQFTGNFPSGSYITIPHDMVVGIHWKNVGYSRIDLDLSMINDTGGKLGWDGSYRNEGRTVLFSGDMTDASKGASELFYVQKQSPSNYILLLNYYNYNNEVEVPFKIVVASENPTNFGMNYMIDPNNIMAITDSIIRQKQMILGLLSVTSTESKFYFAESSIGKSITSSSGGYVKQAKDYLSTFYKHAISLNDVLGMAGAILVVDKEDCDVDLSPEMVSKSTIIDLLV